MRKSKADRLALGDIVLDNDSDEFPLASYVARDASELAASGNFVMPGSEGYPESDGLLNCLDFDPY